MRTPAHGKAPRPEQAIRGASSFLRRREVLFDDQSVSVTPAIALGPGAGLRLLHE